MRVYCTFFVRVLRSTGAVFLIKRHKFFLYFIEISRLKIGTPVAL
jgi:hypothetical protein